jgi:hypothetical protein
MRDSTTRAAVWRFLPAFVVVFGLLIAPWPGWNGAYADYFRAFGSAVFSVGDGNRVVVFAPSSGAAPGLDTQVTLGNRALLDEHGRGLLKRTEIDSRSIGWVPTALTIALVAATPIPWRRRLLALAGGLVLIHAFIFFSLLSWIWDNSPDLSLLTLSDFWRSCASQLDYALVAQLGASFSVPVIIWIVVTFRRHDRLA